MTIFDPFLSFNCARVEGVGAQSEERKGSNFAIWQPCRQVERLRDLAAVGHALRLRGKAGPTGRRAEGIPGTQFNAVIKYH